MFERYYQGRMLSRVVDAELDPFCPGHEYVLSEPADGDGTSLRRDAFTPDVR
jgi:hypothetical protein